MCNGIVAPSSAPTTSNKITVSYLASSYTVATAYDVGVDSNNAVKSRTPEEMSSPKISAVSGATATITLDSKNFTDPGMCA